MKKILISTSGGDCPGLNAVIRGIVMRAAMEEEEIEIIGSVQAYNGILWEPMELKPLDVASVSGIHYQGGTIIETTNKGGPFAWPYYDNVLGEWKTSDRSDEMIRKLQYLNIDAVISIGGDGSQKISQKLFEKGLNIVGVPKTIDNDLAATDFTFGFQTAVQVATESIDRLITTAASHNRTFVVEVMGRDAGWIALHAAIAGGVDVCLIPEIPYDVNKIISKLNSKYHHGRGSSIIVVAEGALPVGGEQVTESAQEIGSSHLRLGGVAFSLSSQLKASGYSNDIRETILGHVQRGGIPIAYDRVLATQFGVKALEMVLDKEYGKMVSYRHPNIVSVPLSDAIDLPKLVTMDCDIMKMARGVGICFGD